MRHSGSNHPIFTFLLRFDAVWFLCLILGVRELYSANAVISSFSRHKIPPNPQAASTCTNWAGSFKRELGGMISFLVPGQQRTTRLRSSTLGEGFDPGGIQDVIAGKRPLPRLDAPGKARFMSDGPRCICYTDMYIIERSKHHDLHRSRENCYHHTVQTRQANPGITRRILRLRTDDLPVVKDILPSASGRKTHLHRQKV